VENFDSFIGSIAAAVLRKGLKEDTTIGIIVSRIQANDPIWLLTSPAGF
jgi:hypothetical protein